MPPDLTNGTGGNISASVDDASMDNCAINKFYQDAERFMVTERFPFVVVVGGMISVVGFGMTVFLLTILSQKNLRQSNVVYLAVIGVFDLTLFVNYILLIGLGVSKDYFELFWLHAMWNKYVRPMFTLGRITQFAQTYLIISATIERFVVVLESLRRRPSSQRSCCTPLRRLGAILFVLIFTVVAKISSYWEVKVKHSPECEGFLQITAVEGDLFKNPQYIFFKLKIDPVFQVYIPFGSLLCLNVVIIIVSKYSLSQSFIATNATVSSHTSKPTQASPKAKPSPLLNKSPAVQTSANNPYGHLDNIPVSQNDFQLNHEPISYLPSDFRNGSNPQGYTSLPTNQPGVGPPPTPSGVATTEKPKTVAPGAGMLSRTNLRDATYTMIAIVTCYLIANVLHVCITSLEQMDMAFLNRHPVFHTLASDTSSIMVILTSAIRLPIYYVCNGKIREQVRKVFRAPAKAARKRSQLQRQRQQQRQEQHPHHHQQQQQQQHVNLYPVHSDPSFVKGARRYPPVRNTSISALRQCMSRKRGRSTHIAYHRSVHCNCRAIEGDCALRASYEQQQQQQHPLQILQPECDNGNRWNGKCNAGKPEPTCCKGLPAPMRTTSLSHYHHRNNVYTECRDDNNCNGKYSIAAGKLKPDCYKGLPAGADPAVSPATMDTPLTLATYGLPSGVNGALLEAAATDAEDSLILTEHARSPMEDASEAFLSVDDDGSPSLV